MQTFARRLYRFVKRGLTLWPEQRSLRPVLSLWLAYLAPWGPSQPGDSTTGSPAAERLPAF